MLDAEVGVPEEELDVEPVWWKRGIDSGGTEGRNLLLRNFWYPSQVSQNWRGRITRRVDVDSVNQICGGVTMYTAVSLQDVTR